MNDDELQEQLQAGVPELSASYWDTIDARLADIEQSDDFDHPASDNLRDGANAAGVDAGVMDAGVMDAGVTSLDGERWGGDQSSSRLWLAAAAVLIVGLLGAVALANRPGSDPVGQLDVATQPGEGDAVEDQLEESGGSQDAIAASPIEGELVCYRSADPTPRLNRQVSSFLELSPWMRVALAQTDPATDTTSLVTWEDIPPGLDELPVLLSASITGDPQGMVELRYTATTMDGSIVPDSMFNSLLAPAEALIGNVSMNQVPCSEIQSTIDVMYGVPSTGAAGQVVNSPPEVTHRGWLGQTCFQNEAAYSLLVEDRSYTTRAIAQISFGLAGDTQLLVKENEEVTSLFAADLVADPAAAWDDVVFDIVSAEGAMWGDTKTHSVRLTEQTLTIADVTYQLTDCAALQPEFDLFREIEAERRYWIAANESALPAAPPSRLCFSDNVTVLKINMVPDDAAPDDDALTGALRTTIEGRVTHFAIATRASDDQGLFPVRVQAAAAGLDEEQVWNRIGDSIGTSFGLLDPVSCSNRSPEIAELDRIISTYPEPPGQ